LITDAVLTGRQEVKVLVIREYRKAAVIDKIQTMFSTDWCDSAKEALGLGIGKPKSKVFTLLWSHIGYQQLLHLKARRKNQLLCLFRIGIMPKKLLHRHQFCTVLHVNLPEILIGEVGHHQDSKDTERKI
jgi:hypothetical protein